MNDPRDIVKSRGYNVSACVRFNRLIRAINILRARDRNHRFLPQLRSAVRTILQANGWDTFNLTVTEEVRAVGDFYMLEVRKAERLERIAARRASGETTTT